MGEYRKFWSFLSSQGPTTFLSRFNSTSHRTIHIHTQNKGKQICFSLKSTAKEARKGLVKKSSKDGRVTVRFTLWGIIAVTRACCACSSVAVARRLVAAVGRRAFRWIISGALCVIINFTFRCYTYTIIIGVVLCVHNRFSNRNKDKEIRETSLWLNSNNRRRPRLRRVTREISWLWSLLGKRIKGTGSDSLLTIT